MTRYTRHPDALWMHTLRGMVVLPPDTDEAMTVTSPGELVWELLDEPRTLDDLVDRLAEVFDEPADTLRSDVERLLADLHRIGALTRTGGV